MRLVLAAALSLSLGQAALAKPMTPAKPSPAIAAALADPMRPAKDKERDAVRKPGELLAFAGVKPGDKVGDFIMGGGYFTRIFAKAVGPKGRVYAYQPDEFIKFQASYGAQQDEAVKGYANVTPMRPSLFTLEFPEPLDLVFTAQNYHDLHLKPFPGDAAAKVNAALYKALKPGGVLVIVDHSATDGTGLASVDSLHRIDIAAVKRELAASGFLIVAESQLLRAPLDPRTASVFDPAIRGKTDQFVLKFRKPVRVP